MATKTQTSKQKTLLNNKINISDYFANQEDMEWIFSVYEKFAEHVIVKGFSYGPLLYYYLRHELGKVKYYVDHLHNTNGSAVFANPDPVLDDIRTILRGKKPQQRMFSAKQKYAFAAYMVATYGVTRLSKLVSSRPKKIDNLFITSKRFYHDGVDTEFGSISKNIPGSSHHLLTNVDFSLHGILEHYRHLFQYNNALFLEEEYSLSLIRSVFKDMQLFQAQWNTVKKKSSFTKLFIYRNVNYAPVIIALIDRLLSSSLIHLISLKQLIAKFIEHRSVSNILLSNEENELNKIFLLQKKEHQRIIAFAHEQIYPGGVQTCPHNKKLQEPNTIRPLPDLKLVWNEYGKKTLVSHCNFPESIIRVAGNPRFDRMTSVLAAHQQKEKATAQQHIVYVSEDRVECFPFLLALAKKLPQALIHYKSRSPVDYRFACKQLSAAPSNLRVLPAETNLHELLFTADVVIATVSTVIVEAMFMNKNIVLFDPDIPLPAMPFIAKDLLTRTRTAAACAKECLKLQDSAYKKEQRERYRLFIEQYYAVHGAEQRAAQEIRSYLSSS
ncbi:MAG: hypothetical protein H6502_03045 [Candidatus Woesearchaeota archaeon]|nr:MAG: hypothetical protein H6502_03045 [Candidatus Woesearchaeota archaeon]